MQSKKWSFVDKTIGLKCVRDFFHAPPLTTVFLKLVQDVILTLLFDMFVKPSDHHVPTLEGRIDLFVC